MKDLMTARVRIEPAPGGRRNEPDRQLTDTAEIALQRAQAWFTHTQARRRLNGDDGRLNTVTEPGAGCSDYVYDDHGDLIEIREPDRRRSQYAYDEQRRLTDVLHPDGGRTCYDYDPSDRLLQTNDRGLLRRYSYDEAGRLARIHHGNTGTTVFNHDEHGRITKARTANVTTQWEYGAQNRICAISQAFDGTQLRVDLDYDPHGRLSSMRLPGLTPTLHYGWDTDGKPTTVHLGDELIADIDYEPARHTVRARLGNGLTVQREADPVDGRPLCYAVYSENECLFRRDHNYGAAGLVRAGDRAFEYDALDRLVGAVDETTGTTWRYTYDSMDNRISREVDGHRTSYEYDTSDRLTGIVSDDSGSENLTYDPRGRLRQRTNARGTWGYRYDDADTLTEVRRNAHKSASFVYDHKGLLICATFADRVERYVYGPSDELLMVVDSAGVPQRVLIHTPMGLLAEVRLREGASPAVHYAHTDTRGTLLAFSDSTGRIAERFAYSPFGVPLNGGRGMFGGHLWFPEAGLYYCRARWYDPSTGRFVSKDTYSGAPDDERLTLPIRPASQQSGIRAQLLGDWLKQPRVRNRYAYCGNDPVSRVDPNGHWSFGWVVLNVLGAIWTLPNTLVGLAVEISCLILEGVRWLLFGITFGNFNWDSLHPPGFDAAASGRLNAFAVVFTGGWIGSFEGLLGLTFGNVFFVNPDWEEHEDLGGPGDVFPTAYNGNVILPRREALYEHELRHVNHQSWMGSFYYIGLPLWGVFVWDLMLNGYCNMWLERDARRRAGV